MAKSVKLVAGIDGWPAPPPPAKLPTLETLEAAKARLVELTSKWASGVCQGEMWTTDGELINLGHTACHAWIGYAFKSHIKTGDIFSWSGEKALKKGSMNILTLSCHNAKHKTCSKAASDEIILWMASDESPFGKYILNRDDKESLTGSGAVILCGPDGATQAEVMWMCKVLRYSVEGQQSLDTWLALYKAGIHPLLAVLVCNYIATTKGAVFNATTVSSHVSVFTSYPAPAGSDVDSIMNFKVNREATNTDGVFRDPQSKSTQVSTKIAAFCKPFAKDDGWGGKITGNGVGAEDLVAKVLEWQQELGGYIPGARFSGDSLGVIKEAPLAPPAPPPLPKGDTVYLDFDM